MDSKTPHQIGVIGSGNPTLRLWRPYIKLESSMPEAGATVICGGRGGVMETVCRGAIEKGGLTVGILPESS